jgi:hypothetical protein
MSERIRRESQELLDAGRCPICAERLTPGCACSDCETCDGVVVDVSRASAHWSSRANEAGAELCSCEEEE